ncbi:MAG TPA: penicillin acylase family protein [Alphaproteobacteria bacterium]|nr:penicillin acylase family protein [Alphaproteobacteria bacterium]
MSRKKILRFAATVVILIAAAVFAGFLWLRGSLPQERGEISLPGLSGPVKIVRDLHGIPTIRAASEHDAYFALGFVHAQDRLWQMDVMRRAGAGRLAEIVGSRGLQSDKFMRTLGLYRLAEAEVQGLDPATRAAFEAYSDGVNAYLDHHEGAWPLEYYLLRTRPWHWKPADSLVWGRLMALRLSSDFREELLRARLLKRLSPAQVSDLWPSYKPGWPDGVSAALSPSVKQALGEIRWDAIAGAIPDSLPKASASNSWVVDGRHSASGKPELANDPHLHLEAPGVWYLARVEAPGLMLAGATAPGVPLMIAGHNASVAWGFTSSYIDSQDLFIERVDESDSSRYAAPSGILPFTTRSETIKVRGGADVAWTVRETRHGPVVSDVLAGTADIPPPAGGTYVVALADAGLRADDRTAEAIYAVNHAKNADDVIAALAGFDTPPQTITYADAEGNVGFYSVGRVPVRKKSGGLFPVPGWSGDFDWAGLVPFGELPHARNPKEGRIIAANHRVVNGDYPYFLSAFWPAPYRARRIAELLDDLSPVVPAEAAATQLDTISLAAQDLLPRLLAAPVASAQAQSAHEMLARWDGDMRRDRPEPLIYSAWLLELGRGLTSQRLGPFAEFFGAIDPMVLDHILSAAPEWCDDPANGKAESCDEAISAALERALAVLSKTYGGDTSRWRWDQAHRARFHNAILGEVPLLGSFADIEIPTGGDDSTVNRGTYAGTDASDPFAHVHGAGFRGVYDLSDLDGSLFMIAPGESGNVLSPHYRDFAYPWRNGQYLLLPGQPERGGGSRTLTLRPERG